MKRWLYARRPVVGDPSVLAGRLRSDVRGLLRQATGTTEDTVAVDGSFLVQLRGDMTGLGVAKTVRVTTGVATEIDQFERRLELPLRWHADPLRHAFPTFEGALELIPLSSAAADLALVGAYTAPLGPLGAALDAIALHGVAERTGERLVNGLALALSRPALEAEGGVEPDDIVTPGAALRVGDLMTPDPLVLDAKLRIRTAALLLHHYGVHGAPVVDDHDGLIGVLSEADLLEKEAARRHGFGRAVDESWRRSEARTVGDACTRPARTTVPDATVHDAARAMLDARVGRLVVVDQSRVAGVLSRSDIVRALLRSDAELQAAVDAVLSRFDEPHVEATVDWGVVTLGGTVSRCSRVGAIVARVEEIDGVAGVDQDLGWDVDDIVLSLPPFV